MISRGYIIPTRARLFFARPDGQPTDRVIGRLEFHVSFGAFNDAAKIPREAGNVRLQEGSCIMVTKTRSWKSCFLKLYTASVEQDYGDKDNRDTNEFCDTRSSEW